MLMHSSGNASVVLASPIHTSILFSKIKTGGEASKKNAITVYKVILFLNTTLSTASSRCGSR